MLTSFTAPRGGVAALPVAGRSTMIMPRRNDPLLMPVNPLFIWSTLAFAFVLNIVPLGGVVSELATAITELGLDSPAAASDTPPEGGNQGRAPGPSVRGA